MSTQYYYMDGSDVCGPCDAATLLALQQEEKLTSDSLICPEGADEWRPISRHARLCLSKPEPTPAPITLPTPKPTEPIEAAVATQPAHKQAAPKLPLSAKLAARLAPAKVETPGIAVVIHIVTGVHLIAGILFSALQLLLGEIGFFTMLLSMGGTIVTVILLVSLSSLLTWVYNIMLDTKRRP